MSRVREVSGLYFDKHKHNEDPTVGQLERLADLSGDPIEDLLEAGFNQKQVMEALRSLEGTMNRPPHIRAKIRLAEDQACRICTPLSQVCEGQITRHHFVPKWMMKELEDYRAYASRGVCTIPICLGRHRDLHLRGEEPRRATLDRLLRRPKRSLTSKHVSDILSQEERGFADKLIQEFRDQHPGIFDNMVAGDETSYEHILVMDFLKGRFKV